MIFEVIFLSGARPALPMGVAPEAMFGCRQPSIGSNVYYEPEDQIDSDLQFLALANF